MTKQELIRLVERLRNADYASEEEGDRLMETLQANVSHPEVSDLLFYPDREMTAEEIVERALAYKPIRLPAQMGGDEPGE